MYLIVSGRCESRHVDPSGHLITEIHGPGDTLGDREVMQHEPYLATATVVTQSALLRIPAEELRTVFETEPKVAGRLSQSIVRRIMEARAPMPGKRIVALHALSAQVNERMLGRRLADALAEITQRTCIERPFEPGAGTGRAGRLGGDRAFAEWRIPFIRDRCREVRRHCYELDIQAGINPAEAACVAPLLSHLGNHFDYVLVDAGKDVTRPALLQCLVQSDLTYLLMRPG